MIKKLELGQKVFRYTLDLSEKIIKFEKGEVAKNDYTDSYLIRWDGSKKVTYPCNKTDKRFSFEILKVSNNRIILEEENKDLALIEFFNHYLNLVSNYKLEYDKRVKQLLTIMEIM